MADDAEVLDWGGEDDEHYGEGVYRTTSMGDADDVVSIGGEEDDMQELAAYHSRSLRDNGNDDSPPASMKPPSVESGKPSAQRDSGDKRVPVSPPPNTSSFESSASRRSSLRHSKSQSQSVKAPLMHALPPKPVVAPVPSARTSGFIGASVMSDSRQSQEKDGGRRRANGSNPPFSDALPPDWEIRHPTSGEKGEIYYFNIRTLVSQWERPSLNGKVSSQSPRAFDGDDFSERRTDNKLSRARSSGDLRSDRTREAHDFKEIDRSRPMSPVQSLSYNDRHYRPSNGVVTSSSRGLQRDRRGPSPPFVHTQNAFRDDMPKDALNPQGKVRPERDVPRPYGQRSDIDEGRPLRSPSPGLPEIPVFSRNDLREGEPDRLPRGAGSDRGRGRGRGTRRDAGPAQDIRTQKQHFTLDPSGTSHTANQLREPPPRSGDDTVPSTHRRYRSRSPPHLRGSASFRDGNEATHNYEESPAERDAFPRLPSGRPSRPTFQPNIPTQRSQWNQPLSGHPDAEVSMNFDLPARRPREHESTPKTNMGADAKRRRIDSMTADPPFTRRGRSASPIDTRDTFHSDPYAGSLDDQQRRRGNNNDGKRPSGGPQSYSKRDEASFSRKSRPSESADRTRDVSFDNRSTNNGSVPLGPRQRTVPFPVDAESRDPIDSSRRQLPLAGPSSYQQADRQMRRENRSFGGGRPLLDRVPGENRSANSPELMDIDGPRARATGPPPNAGSMYSDRMVGSTERRESVDRLPTGPRAMHSKVMPPSPSVFVSAPGALGNVLTSPETPMYDGRRSPSGGMRGRRNTRFGGREDSQRTVSDRGEEPSDTQRMRTFDSSKEQLGSEGRPLPASVPHGEPPRTNDWLPSERPDIPNGPRHDRHPIPSRTLSPKLTGANNVPVPLRKGWKVDNSTTASPTPHDNHRDPMWDERSRPGSNRPIQVGRGMISPETRYKNLHGDVERRMTLSDRNVNNHEIRASPQDSLRKLDEPEQQQYDKLSPPGSQNARRPGPRIVSPVPKYGKKSNADMRSCQSRFSKPQENAALVTEKDDEPRIWISREAAEDLRGRASNGGEGRAHSPPRSSETTRSIAGPPSNDGYARRDQTFRKESSSRGASKKDLKETRANLPPSNVHKSLQSHSSLELRDRRVGDVQTPSSNPSAPQHQPQASTGSLLLERLESHAIRYPGGRVDPGADTVSETSPGDDRSVDNSIGPIHPSRFSILGTASSPSTASQPLRQENASTEELRSSQSAPLRIKRPHSKFGDASQQNSSSELSHTEVYHVDVQSEYDGRERPSQLRSNSLLERLNMDADINSPSASQPSLRERVELPPKWRDNDSGRENPTVNPGSGSGLEGSYSNYSEGYRGRSQGRGRGRGGRGRRVRGRGGSGGFNDS